MGAGCGRDRRKDAGSVFVAVIIRGLRERMVAMRRVLTVRCHCAARHM